MKKYKSKERNAYWITESICVEQPDDLFVIIEKEHKTAQSKIYGLISLAKMQNEMGKTFILKQGFGFAKSALEAAGVRFRMEEPLSHNVVGLRG